MAHAAHGAANELSLAAAAPRRTRSRRWSDPCRPSPDSCRPLDRGVEDSAASGISRTCAGQRKPKAEVSVAGTSCGMSTGQPATRPLSVRQIYTVLATPSSASWRCPCGSTRSTRRPGTDSTAARAEATASSMVGAVARACDHAPRMTGAALGSSDRPPFGASLLERLANLLVRMLRSSNHTMKLHDLS